MYLAIVFLPLLGCILAGAIAIVGARARFPGGETAHGCEGHAHDLGPMHRSHRRPATPG